MCQDYQLNDKYDVNIEHGHSSPKKSIVQITSGITKQPTYQCEECGKSYGVLGHFLNHQRSHRQASKSVFHDLEHLKKKSFQCEFCGRSYSRASALDAHRRCHEEKLVKLRCKSSSETEPTLDDTKSIGNHTEEAEKTLDPEKKFKCSCSKSFATLLRLKTHQRFSRNSLCSPEEMLEKIKKSADFQCRHCNKTFSGQIALFNHERWHAHDDAVKKFPCEECGKVFMTLTFYYRHQRIAHSKETPSKSFLHQVCQLQKKSFECKVCGLKFSRASALHSHELHHTDVFKETEKEALVSTSLLPQQNHQKKSTCETTEADCKEVFQNVFPTAVVDEHNVNEIEDDAESFEPGDLIVKVISSSESEDEPAQDFNSDLELLCESDHDVREDGDTAFPPRIVSKAEMDLKIVQIDYGENLPSVEERELDIKPIEERYACPDCYRWFTSPTSLRVHRMWHGVRKRRQLAQSQSLTVTPLDLSCNETNHQKHQFQGADCMTSYPHGANLFNHLKISSAQKNESLMVTKKDYNPKKTLLGPKIYHCEQCGKGFWSLGAFSHHKQSPMQCTDLRLRKGFGGSITNGHSRSSFKVTCPVCGRKFRHRGTMALHMRKHENGNHKCDICNRSFRLFSGLLRHRAVHNSQLLPPPVKSFQHQVEQLQKNTYSCPDCGKLFSREKALQFHMKSHGYETGYSPPSQKSADILEDLQCASCFAHFNKKSSLRAHIKLCSKRERQRLPPKNDSCTTALTQKNNLLVNVDTKTETEKPNVHELKYKCKVCDRSFSVVGALNFHKRIHTESHKALAKAKALVKKSKLEESNIGPFHCLDCGRRFVSNSALGSHKRWHKEKPCSVSLLDQDANKKTELGPYKCNKCNKKFFNLRVLQRHQIFNPQCQNTDRELNSDGVESKSSEEHIAFSCTECDQNFEQASLMSVHFENVHGKPLSNPSEDGLGSSVDHVQRQVGKSPPLGESKSPTLKPQSYLLCPLCSMSFANVRGLRAHKWQAHSKRRKKGKKLLKHQVTKSDGTTPKPHDTFMSYIDAKQNSPVNTEINNETEDEPVQTASSFNCFNKQVCQDVKQGIKQELETQEVEVISPSHLHELSAKCLFKCDKCAKAFSTLEQLGNHRAKAKSRPYGCALCCSGFWTENQLQQHFVWHDKIRGRLPNDLRFRINAMASTHQTANTHSSDEGNSSTTNDPLLIPGEKAQSSHKCQQCGKDFLSLSALQKHQMEYCNSDSYHCSVCPRTFSEIQELIDHHQECTGCSLRQRGVTVAVQSGDNAFTCLECGTTFPQENDLHQHYTTHATCMCNKN